MAGQVSNQTIIDLLFLIAPQFITDDPVKLAQYNSLIDALRCQFNERVWACCGGLAFANLLAHYLTISLNPQAGSTSGIHEGDLSISYSTSATEGFYGLTAYGKAYQQLLGNIVATPFVTNGSFRTPGTLAWGPFYGTYGPCC